MLRTHCYAFLLMISLLSSVFSFSVYADETAVVDVNGRPMIVTTAPAPKEVITIPSGYVNCFMVPAGWNYQDMWIAEHKVCQYTPANGGATQGVAWVDGYWACSKTAAGAEPTQANCTSWQWQAAHWVKTLEVY